MTDPRIRRQTLWLLALLWPLGAAAGVIDAVNSVRRHGCGAAAAHVAPLRENARLIEVARHLSQGTQLQQAQRLADYHALSSFSVHVAKVPP